MSSSDLEKIKLSATKGFICRSTYFMFLAASTRTLITCALRVLSEESELLNYKGMLKIKTIWLYTSFAVQS